MEKSGKGRKLQLMSLYIDLFFIFELIHN